MTSGGLAAVSSSAFAALYSAFGKYDVVHIHAEGPAFFAWLPKMFGKRVVVTVHGTCNLSQGVKAEGISIGEMRMLVQLVRDGDLKMERAAEKAKMTVEQFKKMMENTPLGRSL